MGTNYYWFGRCHECGHLSKIHIGKASGGWYFGLHVIPGVIDNLDDWRKRFKEEGSFIMTEYLTHVTSKVMLTTIQDRSGQRDFVSPDQDFLDRNYAEVGKNNLIRFAEGFAGCVRHGEGPWSYIEGEFS